MMFMVWFDRRFTEAIRFGSISLRPYTGAPPE